MERELRVAQRMAGTMVRKQDGSSMPVAGFGLWADSFLMLYYTKLDFRAYEQ
jgi:hypothetical protein